MEVIEIPIRVIEIFGWVLVAIFFSVVALVGISASARRDHEQLDRNLEDSRRKNMRAEIILGIETGLRLATEPDGNVADKQGSDGKDAVPPPPPS